MHTNEKRLSDTISNVNMNSFRAFKILMNDGNILNSINITKKDKKIAEQILINNQNQNVKNTTKHIFSSQSKRFKWQDTSAANTYCDIEFSKNLENKINKKNQTLNWQGMNYINKPSKEKTIFNKK